MPQDSQDHREPAETAADPEQQVPVDTRASLAYQEPAEPRVTLVVVVHLAPMVPAVPLVLQDSQDLPDPLASVADRALRDFRETTARTE